MLPEEINHVPVELELWSRFKKGDEDSFKKIFEKYSDVLLTYGLSIIPEKEQVKDAIQELFIDLWRSRHNLAEVKSVQYYLIVSIRHALVRKITISRRITTIKTRMGRSLQQNTELPVEWALVNRETDNTCRTVLRGEINKLPARQREAIVLRYYQNMAYTDIEKIMNLNNQVLRNTIFRAVKTLKQRLTKASLYGLHTFVFIATFLS